MEIFKTFNETVFLKRDSELEKQIEALKKISKEYPKNKMIAKNLKLCELGLQGEKEIEFELKNANLGLYVLHDITMEYEDLKAQIDYIIISKGLIYFVECKNLIGNITVNTRGEFIREYEINGKRIKEGIYSPLRQSERHVEIFKKIWQKRNNTFIDKVLRQKGLDIWYKPLVVMANSKNILNVRYAKKEVKNKVIRSDSLVNYIKKDIASIDKEYLSSKKEMYNLATSLYINYSKPIHKDYEQEIRKWINNKSKKQVENVENVENDNLKEKLINFRKEIAKDKNIPAYYVFTNEELENILKYKPKTIQELKNLKILKDIKIKVHGENIIKILNT